MIKGDDWSVPEGHFSLDSYFIMMNVTLYKNSYEQTFVVIMPFIHIPPIYKLRKCIFNYSQRKIVDVYFWGAHLMHLFPRDETPSTETFQQASLK